PGILDGLVRPGEMGTFESWSKRHRGQLPRGKATDRHYAADRPQEDRHLGEWHRPEQVQRHSDKAKRKPTARGHGRQSAASKEPGGICASGGDTGPTISRTGFRTRWRRGDAASAGSDGVGTGTDRSVAVARFCSRCPRVSAWT